MKKLILCALLLSSFSVSAKIIFDGSFESGKINPSTSSGEVVDTFYYGAMGPSCTPSTTKYNDSNDNKVVINPVRYGLFANAQTLRYECDYRAFNEGVRQKPRQELKFPIASMTIKEGQEYWIAFSFMLDKDWVSDFSQNPDNLFQLWKDNTDSAPSARKSGMGIMGITERNGKFEMGIGDIGGNAAVAIQYTWPTQKNEWQDIVIHLRPCRLETTNCQGFFDVYLGNTDRRSSGANLKPVYSSVGPNTLADTHRVALNVYKFAWHCTADTQLNYDECMKNPNPTKSTSPRTVYFDELKVGDGNSNLDEVAPYFKSDVAKPGTPNLTVE